MAYTLMVVNVIVGSSEWMSQSVAATSRIGGVAVALALAVLAGSAVLVLFVGLTAGIAYCTVAGIVVAQLLFVFSIMDPSGLPASWWANQLMIPVCSLIFGALPTRRAIALLIFVLGCYAIVRLSMISGPNHGWRATISDLLPLVMFPVAVGLLVPAWRRTAAVADEATRARIQAHALAEGARAADRQRRAAGRLLHDEVIHALRTISLPAGSIDRLLVRRLTSESCELLTAGSSRLEASSNGLARGLEALAAASRLAVQFVYRGKPALPDLVVAAIIGATGEALRNIERHAGVERALIRIAELPAGAEVLIIDDGCGFNAGSPGGSRPLGYRRSILDRLAEVGGTATIDSTLGNGTTVTLTWSPEAVRPDAPHTMADIAGTRTQLMVGAAVPGLIFTAALSALYCHLLSDPVAALLAIGAAIVMTARVLVRSRTRQISGWDSFWLAASGLTAVVVGGWGLQFTSQIEQSYFAAGAGVPALVLIAFFRPSWESLATALAASAAVAAMVHRLDPGWSTMARALPAVTLNVVVGAAVLAARFTIERMSRGILLDEEIQRQAETMRAELALGGLVMAERLGRVRGWVLPFLTAVSQGELDLADPRTRLKATVLEAAVRDDIRLGTALTEAGRSLIARVRGEGRAVEINAEPEIAVQVPSDLLTKLISAALDDGEPPNRTVLTISTNAAGVATVSLLVERATTAKMLRSLSEQLGADVVARPDFLLVRVTIKPSVYPQAGTRSDWPLPLNSIA